MKTIHGLLPRLPAGLYRVSCQAFFFDGHDGNTTNSGTAEAAVMSSVNQGTGFGMFVKDGKFLYKLYTSSGENTRVDGPTAWAKQPVSMARNAREHA